MSHYIIMCCLQCGQKKKLWDGAKVCAACRLWDKNHTTKRTAPFIIRDNFKKNHPEEYSVYRGMKKRCLTKTDNAYPLYGGRGIKICERWLGPYGFHNFYRDMGPRPSKKHSLDRIDVNGDYCPENCRWANANQQSANRRFEKKYSERVGVTFNKALGLWTATLTIEKKRHVKYFRTEHDAILGRERLESLYLSDIN